VLESEEEGEEGPAGEAEEGEADEPGLAAAAEEGAEEGDEDEEGEGEEEPAGAEASAGEAPGPEGRPFDEGPGRRRRRRRRRRRGGDNGMDTFGGPEAGAPGPGAEAGAGVGMSAEGAEPGAEPSAAGEPSAPPTGELPSETGPGGRRIMAPIDAAIEILKGQAPGRGVHVRQIADAAVRRRLIHGEPNEAWRVMRAALAAEPRERLRSGLRPRVRPAGSGLYALARRPPDMDLERAEYVFGEARRALRERTLAGLEQRLSELSPSAFEAIARVLLQREGFGPATFVKRVGGAEGGMATIYLEALRGRGSRPSRCLIGLRPGNQAAGRRAIGELRAGMGARNQDEGILMLAGRLGDDAIAEWRRPGPPIEVIDGAAMADTCIRHGVGIVNATVSVDFVDADFFAEISEG
jgi:hypothetical protein